MDKFFRMPFDDVAGAVGFALMVLAVLFVAAKVGVLKKVI